MDITSWAVGVMAGTILALLVSNHIDRIYDEKELYTYKQINSLSWEEEGRIWVH